MERERIREGAVTGKRRGKGGRGSVRVGGGRVWEVVGPWYEVRQVGKVEEQWEGTGLFPGRVSSEIAFGQNDFGCRIQRRASNA
ncbi:hypothetical protein K523DRAFT_325348 [Schizophyllum commune Tattone D]|nr:hypothetical protein K523DRAFT_325348 [Schizophyllum commune Tattone D]